jgi:hypothetical protein
MICCDGVGKFFYQITNPFFFVPGILCWTFYSVGIVHVSISLADLLGLCYLLVVTWKETGPVRLTLLCTPEGGTREEEAGVKPRREEIVGASRRVC